MVREGRVQGKAPPLSPSRLLVRRERLHRVGVHRYLHLVAERARHECYAHTRKRIHERRVGGAPDTKEAECDAELPETEWQRWCDAIDRGIDLEIAQQPKADEARARESDERRQVDFCGARHEPEEWDHEHEEHHRET